MRVRRRVALVASTCIAVAGSVTGCAAPVRGPVVVLTLASPDKPSDINGPHVQHFAETVARLSHGEITIDPQWDVAKDGTHDWDQAVARAVADGTYDMGLVPSRAWDELGVVTLQALDTPFLLTDLGQVRTVLESDVREDLLQGLSVAGVVGLDLFPSELRHPFGFTRPLLGPQSYRGRVIRAPTSVTTRRFLEALGASVVDDPFDRRVQAGMESSYGPSRAFVATGNVTFFPKVESLVVGADVREHLRDDQWSLLQRAAAETRRWLFETLPTDEESAEGFCRRGGRIVGAGEADVDALRAVGRRVRAQLERDGRVRSLVEAIEDLAPPDLHDAGPTSCPEPAREDAGAAVLDGIYVADVTARGLRAAGVRNPEDIRENAAHYVWTLEGGTWHYEATADHYISVPSESGSFDYEDGVFTFHWNDGGYVASPVRVRRDGSIVFLDPKDSYPDGQMLTDGFFGVPWRRVADLPG